MGERGHDGVDTVHGNLQDDPLPKDLLSLLIRDGYSSPLL